MTTTIYPIPPLQGAYDLRPLHMLVLGGAESAQVGVVRIGAGTRSPSVGRRASARHEIGYIVRGRIAVETERGSEVVSPGSVIVSSPAEPHATTALEDVEIVYILVDPSSA